MVELKNRKVVSMGGRCIFSIPKAFIEHGILKRDIIYDLEITPQKSESENEGKESEKK